ncbi:MAG: DNA polymerase III subunit beta [FCB group bacterium]|nr:DNA polymerase III subunit beta [FCB group bacterium]
MKFTISQEAFSNALQRHIPVIPTRTTLPILNSIKWDVIDGKLRMHSTDLEITLITETEIEAESEGSIAVPARKLTEIVRELPHEPITVIVEDNFRLKLQGLTGFYQIAGSDPEDFPTIPSEGLEERVVLSGDKFKRMIEKTSFAVSRDDMRPTLCGIFFQVTENDIRMVTTDGHRLSKLVDSDFQGAEIAFEAIVPVKALNLAAKNVSSDEEIKISASGNYLMLNLNNDFLYSRLIEGKYPQYENVIPKSNTNFMITNVESLTSAVRRVAIFSNSLTRQVRFAMGAEQMIITAEDVETGGEAEEKLAIDYNGEESMIGYNANYVLDALRHVDSEEVKFLIGSPDAACIIEPIEQEENQHFMMLLMPVRLS